MAKIYGTRNFDTLNGGNDNDIFYGSLGNDTLDGGSGNNTADYSGTVFQDADGDFGLNSIVVNLSTGQVNKTIVIPYLYPLRNSTDTLRNILNVVGTWGNDIFTGNDQNNCLYGGMGSDLFYATKGSDLLDGGSGGFNSTDTADYSLSGFARINADLAIGMVEKFLAANGPVSSVDRLVSIENVVGTAGNDVIKGDANNNGLFGMGGNDTLDGGDGNDQLSGGLNNDVLKGGKGNDTYLFKRGDASDTIVENDATQDNTDVAQFADVNANQLWFAKVGNDLQVSIMGTADKTIVQNWYLGNAYHVEQIKSGNGKTLLDTQVDKLVQAMASLPSSAMGQASLTSQQQTALVPKLAAGTNWL